MVADLPRIKKVRTGSKQKKKELNVKSSPKLTTTKPSDIKSGIITNVYEILEVIGSGGFSEVRKGKNKKTSETVAIKVIEKQKHPDKIDNVKREIEVMRKLNHKHIICLEDVFEEEGVDGKIYMVLEYVGGGELFDHIIGRVITRRMMLLLWFARLLKL